MNITELMQTLDLSETEAKELIEFDNEVDRTKETKNKQKTPKTSTPKPVNRKGEFMQEIFNTIKNNCDDIELTNAEREINFIKDNIKYKIILSCPKK